MAFKPKTASKPQGPRDFEPANYPTPRAGSRKARVSLIVDMGTQKREDFEDEATGEKREQKPCQQIAIFADLVADRVDYGGEIGKAQYRLLLNKSFQNKVQGINFVTTPPKDAKGNLVAGKPWGLHPANLLTKLAKVVGKEEIIYDDRKNPNSLDIEQLLNMPFMATVEVKETEDKNGKKDKDGNVIVYKNVNFRGCAMIPEDDDGNPIEVAELDAEPLCITFENATKESVKFIRAGLRRQIKEALDYEGSAMQKAIDAYEAELAAKAEANGEEEQEAEKPAAPSKSKPAAKAAAKPKAKPTVDDMDDDDIPF